MSKTNKRERERETFGICVSVSNLQVHLERFACALCDVQKCHFHLTCPFFYLYDFFFFTCARSVITLSPSSSSFSSSSRSSRSSALAFFCLPFVPRTREVVAQFIMSPCSVSLFVVRCRSTATRALIGHCRHSFESLFRWPNQNKCFCLHDFLEQKSEVGQFIHSGGHAHTFWARNKAKFGGLFDYALLCNRNVGYCFYFRSCGSRAGPSSHGDQVNMGRTKNRRRRRKKES